MFNNEDTVEVVLDSLFKKIAQAEEMYGKNCADFTVPEIMAFYKTLGTVSPTLLQNYNSQLSLYTSWCVKQNLVKDGQSHYDEIFQDTLNKCLNVTKVQGRVLTRDEVIQLCNAMPNYRSKILLMAPFEGIKGNKFRELADLKREDLLPDNYVHIKSRNENVKVSSMLYNWMKEAVDETEIVVERGQAGKQAITFSEGQRDYVIKFTSDARAMDKPGDYKNQSRTIHQYIFGLIKRYEGPIDVRAISAQPLMDSGIIHFIKTRAKELNVSPLEYFETPEALKEIKEKFNKRVVRSQFLGTYKEFLK